MPKLSQLTAIPWQHVLLFGPPKSGKTTVAGELAKHGFDLVWFDLEKGSTTLRQLNKEEQDRIDIVAVPDSPMFPIAIETCLKVIKPPPIDPVTKLPGVWKICTEHGKVACPTCMPKTDATYDTVNLYARQEKTIYVFDSITQLVNSAINNIRKGKPDDYKFEWDDWGALGIVMERFFSYVQNLPGHIVCISHETEVEMEDGKLKLVATAGTRNFSRNSAKYFDHVVYSEVKNKTHVAASSTTYANNILTGSRLAIATELAATPSLIDIFTGKIGSAQAQPAVIKNLIAQVKK